MKSPLKSLEENYFYIALTFEQLCITGAGRPCPYVRIHAYFLIKGLKIYVFFVHLLFGYKVIMHTQIFRGSPPIFSFIAFEEI